MGVPRNSGHGADCLQKWGWEAEPPSLSAEQSALLEETIDEIQASPRSSNVDVGRGKSAVWRYLEGAQWCLEPVRGKRVSDFFLETLQWRSEEGVDDVFDRSHSFAEEASSGKLFVRGTCRLGRPLIWVHLGRENNALDPEANVRFLVYTVERAIASMGAEALGPASKGQFCVVVDCSMVGAGGQLPSIAFARQAVSLLMRHYPSRLGKLFIVDAGLTAYYAWQAISLLLTTVTRDKIAVVSGTDKQRRDVLLEHISAEALEGGRLGCPGEPPFDAETYLAGGDAGGVGGGGVVVEKPGGDKGVMSCASKESVQSPSR